MDAVCSLDALDKLRTNLGSALMRHGRGKNTLDRVGGASGHKGQSPKAHSERFWNNVAARGLMGEGGHQPRGMPVGQSLAVRNVETHDVACGRNSLRK